MLYFKVFIEIQNIKYTVFKEFCLFIHLCVCMCVFMCEHKKEVVLDLLELELQ